MLDYVRAFVPEPGKAPLGGNTVATDRAFLARDMADLEAHLHYRIIDVSSIKELSRRWFPRAYFAAPTKSGGHRALADIRESIAELRYYREAVFVPPPGPSTEQARSIAVRHVVDHGAPAGGPTPAPRPHGHGREHHPGIGPGAPRPERGPRSGAPSRSGYDGPRCGRNGISDAARPPWWV